MLRLIFLLLVLSSLSPLRAQTPVSIIVPARGAVINDLRRANGTFERGEGASAIVRIEVLCKRAVDGAIWNGTSWGRALSWRPAQLSFSTRTWSFSGGPPQSTLSDGAFYFLYARAVPSMGRVSVIANSFVRVDLSGPGISIATFSNGALVSSLRTIGGTAYDKSGVRGVQVGIRREADAKFWNGVSWVDGVQLRGAQLVGSGQGVKWQSSDGPDAIALQPGSYTILAFATDVIGNRNSMFATVQVPLPTPEPGKIVFDSDRDGNREIYIMNPDGTQQTRLTNSEAVDVDPALSFDRRKIVFISVRNGTFDLYVVNADGTDEKRLTFGHRYIAAPAWSPDGTQITFSSFGTQSETETGANIYIINEDGSNQRQLTRSSRRQDHSPSFSMDGRKIIFSGGVSGGGASGGGSFFELFTIDTDGQNEQLIPGSGPNAFDPAYLQNGWQLVYAQNTRGLYIANADGSDARMVPGTESDYDPSPSPDSLQIAFSSFREAGYQIYAINIDGTQERRLTQLGANHNPDWK